MFVASPSVLDALERMNRAGKEGKPFFFALDYELEEAILWLEPTQTPPPVKGLCFTVGEVRCGTPCAGAPPSITSIGGEGTQRYAQRFDAVQSGLMRGDSFLINLTLRTPIELEGTLDDVYRCSSARYQLLYPERFVCFSPEPFVHIEQTGRIATFPMKGTIDASLPNAAELIRGDYKEGAEHYTIVDLMRNDLNRVGEHIRVERFKYLDRLRTSRGDILQMSSEIVGVLPADWQGRIGDILLALLPAGSISGAPKGRTCEIILEAEGLRRGFYTGISGYFDGQTLDTGVLIRYIEQEGDKYYYRSGGGITINSKMEEEYQECLQKIYLPLSHDL